MKEYIVRCGNYRHFIVRANSPEQARYRFDMASKENIMATVGFKVKDITDIVAKNK